MSKLKTIVPILFVAFMFLGMSKISAAKVDAGLSLNKPNITAKDAVEITINFNQSVGATEFELNFDETKFDFVKVSNDVNYNPITKKGNYFSATKSINEAVFTFKSKTNGTAEFVLAGLKTSDLSGNMYTSNIKENNLDVEISKPQDNNNDENNENNENNDNNNNDNNTPPQTGNKVPNPSTGTQDEGVEKTDVKAPVPEEEINTPNYNGDQTDNQNKNSTNNQEENNSIKSFVDNYGVITVVAIVLIIAAAIVVVRNRRKV